MFGRNYLLDILFFQVIILRNNNNCYRSSISIRRGNIRTYYKKKVEFDWLVNQWIKYISYCRAKLERVSTDNPLLAKFVEKELLFPWWVTEKLIMILRHYLTLRHSINFYSKAMIFLTLDTIDILWSIIQIYGEK